VAPLNVTAVLLVNTPPFGEMMGAGIIGSVGRSAATVSSPIETITAPIPIQTTRVKKPDVNSMRSKVALDAIHDGIQENIFWATRRTNAHQTAT
jgi:hypothetical protein